MTKSNVFVAVFRYGYGQFHQEIVRVQQAHRISKYAQNPIGLFDFCFDLFAQRDHNCACAWKISFDYGITDSLVLLTKVFERRVVYVYTVNLFEIKKK